jgi:hypothetical protein
MLSLTTFLSVGVLLLLVGAFWFGWRVGGETSTRMYR